MRSVLGIVRQHRPYRFVRTLIPQKEYDALLLLQQPIHLNIAIDTNFVSAIDETAIVPAAPPSKLSKKFTELQMPTIQIVVMIASTSFDPVGVPTVLEAISSADVKIPAMV
jgi:hypothetical protein